MSITKILVPLDGSELAERILVHVQRVLTRTDADVTLFHAVPEKAIHEFHPPGQDALALAKRRLGKLRDGLVENGAKATVRIGMGDPAARILEVERELSPSLIALSTHGRTGLARLVRGSVAERVLRHATAPVLVANPTALPEHQPLRVRRILVPVDGSELSAEILPLATELAKLFEAELVLAYCIETIPVPEPGVMITPPITREDAAAILDGFAKRIDGVPVRARIAFGAPAGAILDLVADEKADLIALTTHGRSGLSRWAFGSVAEHVLRHAPCPLLVKRSAGVAEAAPAEAVKKDTAVVSG